MNLKQRLILLFCLVVGIPTALEAQEMVLRRHFRPDPMKLQGTASGKASLAGIAGSASGCRGFAQDTPSHIFTLAESFPLMDIVAFTPNINQDLTMLIKGPNSAIWCADDEYQGRSPRVSARLSKGTYQIWIGAGELNQAIPYTLSLSETPHK